jgi:cyclopropane-fatty-acyl-phospholipid synthase
MNTYASPSFATRALANPAAALQEFALPQRARSPSGRERRVANEVGRLLDALAIGQVSLICPDGTITRHGHSAPRAADLVWAVHDWSVFGEVIARGDIGFGEAFVDGRWRTNDLTGLLTLLNRNRDAIRGALYGRWLPLLVERLRHALNANSHQGSRRNIMAHYDLGNAFYAEWLDATMSYSSALFDDGAGTLEDAQGAKYRRIVGALGIRPGDRVLEIGCGWGGFAEIAAREAGARVTGITLSPAQLDFARQRMARAGLADRVDLELCDYRDVHARHGSFDHVVSIEMFEAVGESWWPTYFRTLSNCLKPGGSALVQTITIDDRLFDAYRRGTDFIQQHVFPGGMLPSPGAFRTQAARAGLAVADSFAFGFDYARTLALWQQSFNARRDAIAAQGFDDRFMRLWNFYLSYCQAGFATGSTDVVQFRLGRAGRS